MKLTMNQLRDYLFNIWLDTPETGLAEIVPLIIGASGIGKTALIKQLAKEKGMNLYVYALGGKSKYDLQIYPKEKDESVIYLKPEWIKENTIVFFDDVHAAAPDVQTMLLEVLQTRSFANYKFPDTLYIIMAMNPIDDENYHSMLILDNALATRVTQLEVTFSPNDIDTILEFMHPLVGAFLKNNSTMILEPGPEEEGKPYATPRTWEKLSKQLFKIQEKIFGSDTSVSYKLLADRLINQDVLLYAITEGTVGRRAAEQFIAFLNELPIISLEEFFKRGYTGDKDLQNQILAVDLITRVKRWTQEEIREFLDKYQDKLAELLNNMDRALRNTIINIFNRSEISHPLIEKYTLELQLDFIKRAGIDLSDLFEDELNS